MISHGGKNDPNQSDAHMRTVDTQYPLLVTIDEIGHLSVADGLNRLKKLRDVEHRTTANIYLVPWDEETKAVALIKKIDEVIRYRDRINGEIIAINPSAIEFTSNFKEGAAGILTKKGDLIIGAAPYQLEHFGILNTVGIPLNQDRYHLGVWPDHVVVELWDNFDDVPENVIPPNISRSTRTQRRAFVEKYGRFPKKYRDTAGHVVRMNKHIQRMYDNNFKVFVDLYAPEFADGAWIRDQY